MFLPADRKPRTRDVFFFFLMDGVGWGGVGQAVTVMWTSAHTWCYATDIFSRLSYIFHATLGWGGVGGARCSRQVNFCPYLMLRYRHLIFSRFSCLSCYAGVGWGKMLPSGELLHILDATLPASSLDFHTSFMLRWGGVGQDVTVR